MDKIRKTGALGGFKFNILEKIRKTGALGG